MGQKVKVKKFTEFLGIDKHTNELTPLEGYQEDLINLCYVEQNKTGIKPGCQPIGKSGGGHGIMTYNRFVATTQGYTSEILVISDTLEKATADVITVAYAGTGTAVCIVYSDPANARIKFMITENGTTKLDYSLGKGYDEVTPVALSDLKTQIDAISGGLFSATISGTTSTPAALIRRTAGKTMTQASPTAVFTAYHFTAVNTPVAAMMSWYETNKDASFFQNCVGIQARNATFFPNPTTGYGMMKYDGQTFYRAGVPDLAQPVCSVISALSGVAEITSLVARGAAGTAEISTVTTIADTGVAEGWTAVFSGTWSKYQGKYMTCGDASGSVAIWWNTGGSSEPSHGCDRAIEVDLSSHGPSSNVALKTKEAIDADGSFSASVSSTTVTVTNSASGVRTDPTLGTVAGADLALSVTVQGTSGLNNKYFNLYDNTGKVTVWINVASTGTQPSTGAVRYIPVAISASASANTVATAVKTAVDADAAFIATNLNAVVTITHASAYAVTDLEAATSGFAVAVTTPGVDSLQSKYFILYDDSNDSVAFWFNIAGGGVEPAHGATRSVAMTTIGASDADTAVATAVEAYIEADEWGSTVASATITATANSTGARTAPSAGTSGFTITVTTPGVTAGVGAGIYKYRLQALQRDANGFEVEGNLTEPVSVTHTTGAQDTQIVFEQIQPTTGYNTGAAKVNGNQSAVTAITVDSGHTLLAGDQAYLYDRATSAYVTRTVVSVGATTVTVNTAVSVSDNDPISNGLRILIWRTKANQDTYFLAHDEPNLSLQGSVTFRDSVLDINLGAELIQPATDRSPPGNFKYLTLYKGVAVGSGFGDDPDRVGFSDIESIEYWPADGGNQFLVDTNQGDAVSAISENNEVLVVGKLLPSPGIEGSYQVVSGNLDEFGNFSRDVKSASLGISSHSSIVEMLAGVKLAMATKGPHLFVGGNAPEDIGFRIDRLLTQNFSTNSAINRTHVTAVNDSLHERVLFFIPVEPTSGTKYAATDSFVIVFDYSSDPDGNPINRWFTWNGINAAAGFAKFGSDIVFSERRLSSVTGQVEHLLWAFNNEGTDQDCYDHVDYIGTTWKTRWLDLSEPNVNKFFKWLRLMIVPSAGAFSVGVEVERDFAPGIVQTSKTLTFTGDQELDEDDKVKMNEGKAKAIRLTFRTTTAAVRFFYSGFEIEADMSYSEGMA